MHTIYMYGQEITYFCFVYTSQKRKNFPKNDLIFPKTNKIPKNI